ncbi:MAG: GNAT family N-acetyltransferase, partial [Anaerolineae bacterium]|nr:GNAT family N-acetyltransferase [Anaerolineae bacterium]
TTMEDAAYYQRIIVEVFDKPPDLAPDMFDAMVGRQDGHTMLARQYGRAVGTGRLLYINGVASIYEVATRPDAQRQGVGTAVMRALQEQALADGYAATVLASSRAGLALYRKLGYRHDGYQVAYAPSGQ